MLLTKEVKMKVTKGNLHIYKEKYKCKIGDNIHIPINDVKDNADIEIEYLCDYCLEEGISEIVKKSYARYTQNLKRSIIKKDACEKCKSKKRKESNQLKYRVDNISQLDKVKLKKEETCIEHYGVKCNLTIEGTKDQIRQTNLEKYGVDNPAKNNEVKEKARQTNILRYGVDWTSQSEQMQKNKEKTFLIKYGAKTPMQNEEYIKKLRQYYLDKFGVISPLLTEKAKVNRKKAVMKIYGVNNVSQSEEIKIKKAETFYRNGTVATSRQQKYLHMLIGGILNYANDTPSLDIVLLDEKIYIEYNGSGHDLCVYTKQMTQKDFENRERRRYYYMKRKGWKGIFINSPCDYLPSDEIIIQEINEAKEWFKTDDEGHWHYDINLGDKIKDPIYGKLRRIKEEDLQEAVI